MKKHDANSCFHAVSSLAAANDKISADATCGSCLQRHQKVPERRKLPADKRPHVMLINGCRQHVGCHKTRRRHWTALSGVLTNFCVTSARAQDA